MTEPGAGAQGLPGTRRDDGADRRSGAGADRRADARADARSASGDRRGGDRRQGDRRRIERRAETPAPEAPSWFGDFDDGAASRATGLDTIAPDAASWGGPALPSDGPSIAREAWRAAFTPGAAFGRVMRMFVGARALVGLALLVAQAGLSLGGQRSHALVVTVCALYAMQALALWLVPSARRWLIRPPGSTGHRRAQWLATVGVDVLVFGLLHELNAGVSLNYAALLALPVLMSGVLMPRAVALATAGAIGLALIVSAWRNGVPGAELASTLAQWGLAGIGFLGLTLLAGELAARLAREEMAARGSLAMARQQAHLNRLIIQEMADGVLAVDRRLRVRSANPAARRLLGLRPIDDADGAASEASSFDLRDESAWAPLADAVEAALAGTPWPESGQDVRLELRSGLARTVRVRMRLTHVPGEHGAGPGGAGDAAGAVAALGYGVVLLEDARTVQQRLQQEKLAAMGRMTAGIAHELRNPLAAIAQANALLAESAAEASGAGDSAPVDLDLSEPRAGRRVDRAADRAMAVRLTGIVHDNVQRLQRLITDVLDAAPTGVAADGASPIDAADVVDAALRDWQATHGLQQVVGLDATDAPGPAVHAELPAGALAVEFDPEHLRRVLVNLLDNGWRHGTQRAGAVVVRLAARDERTAVLSVASDGPPIAPEVEPLMFEPFFSTRSRGSGLGLYLCRELCERHGGAIEFRPRPVTQRHRNGFVVTLRRPRGGVDAQALVAGRY